MREIKFRLIKKGKIVGYENHMLCLNGIQLEQNHVNEWGNPHPIGYIIHDHKDQFTGLKDKDDKEIYERDIIENRMGVRGTIIFKDGTFCKEFLDDEKGSIGLIYCLGYLDARVIGNIYENPSLIHDSHKIGGKRNVK